MVERRDEVVAAVKAAGLRVRDPRPRGPALRQPERAALMEGPAETLAAAIEDALPGWVVRSVVNVATAAGHEVDDSLRSAAEDAGEPARADVGAAVRTLLATDIDAQHTNPLSLLHGAVRYPTAVLREAGVAPTGHRDEFAVRAFPDDVYDLAPATWTDVDESLQEPGISWERGRPTRTSVVVGISDRPPDRHARTRLEEQASVGAAERGVVVHREAALLDAVAGGQRPSGVVAAMVAYGHHHMLRTPILRQVAERLVIIGGDAGGMAAVSQVRRTRPDMEIVAFERGDYTSYSACGIPYLVGGEIAELGELVSRSPQEFRDGFRVDVRMRHEVIGLDVNAREVEVRAISRTAPSASVSTKRWSRLEAFRSVPTSPASTTTTCMACRRSTTPSISSIT